MGHFFILCVGFGFYVGWYGATLNLSSGAESLSAGGVAGARVVKQNKHFLREHKRTRSSIRRGRGKCGKAESDWWGWKIIACRRVLRCSKARDFVWMAVESAGVSVDFGKGVFFGRRRVVVVDKFSGLGGGKVGVGVHRGMWKGVEKPTDSTGLWEGFPGIHRGRFVRKAGCGGIFGDFHKRWDLNVWKTENFPHGFPQGVEKGVLGVDLRWISCGKVGVFHRGMETISNAPAGGESLPPLHSPTPWLSLSMFIFLKVLEDGVREGTS